MHDPRVERVVSTRALLPYELTDSWRAALAGPLSAARPRCRCGAVTALPELRVCHTQGRHVACRRPACHVKVVASTASASYPRKEHRCPRPGASNRRSRRDLCTAAAWLRAPGCSCSCATARRRSSASHPHKPTDPLRRKGITGGGKARKWPRKATPKLRPLSAPKNDASFWHRY